MSDNETEATHPTPEEAVAENPTLEEVVVGNPTPEEAAKLLRDIDLAADKVLTLERFPKWWLALFATLIAGAYSLPLLAGNRWGYVAGVAAGTIVAYVILTLTWPKLIRTGLGQDERVRLQSTLMLFPMVMPPVLINAFYNLRGDSPWLLMLGVFVGVTLLLGVFAWGVLRWFRVRVRARVFDFSESEEIWDSAQAEIRRRVAEVKARDKAAIRAAKDHAAGKTAKGAR